MGYLFLALGVILYFTIIELIIGAFILGEIIVVHITLLLYWFKNEPFKGMWKLENFFLTIVLFLFYSIFTLTIVFEDLISNIQ